MTFNGRDQRLALLAERQSGMFTLEQARAIGFPTSTAARRGRTGAWLRVHTGVYGMPGAVCWSGALWAAWLAVGHDSVVTHESAAIIHGGEDLPADPIVLTNPHRWHHHVAGVFVHQIDDLLPIDVVRWNGLPVSSPARCVVELGATQAERVVGRVADDLINSRRTSLRAIEQAFRRVARPGKPGMLTVARVIDRRADGEPPSQSFLEDLLFQVLEAGGLPRPRRQIPLPGRGGVKGVVDAGYPDAQLLLEADGRRWHARVESARLDRARDAQAARAGWQTLRFGYEELTQNPADVCRTVAETLEQRLRLLRHTASPVAPQAPRADAPSERPERALRTSPDQLVRRVSTGARRE
jgi:very-short-patch-repair endonuclease